jgi:hypothetical protein
VPRTANAKEFYVASARFVQECLRREGSLFTPGRTIWARGPVEDLYERFVGSPDWTKGVDSSQVHDHRVRANSAPRRPGSPASRNRARERRRSLAEIRDGRLLVRGRARTAAVRRSVPNRVAPGSTVFCVEATAPCSNCTLLCHVLLVRKHLLD